MESNLRDKLIASFSSKAMVNLLRSTEKKVENRPNRFTLRNTVSPQSIEKKVFGFSATPKALNTISKLWQNTNKHSLSSSDSGIDSNNTSKKTNPRRRIETPDKPPMGKGFLKNFFPKHEQETANMINEKNYFEKTDKPIISVEISNTEIKQVKNSISNQKLPESNSTFGTAITSQKQKVFSLKEKIIENIQSFNKNPNTKEEEEKKHSDRDYQGLYQEQCLLNSDLRKQVDDMSRKMSEMKNSYENNVKILQRQSEELVRSNRILTLQLEKVNNKTSKIEALKPEPSKGANYDTLSKEQLINEIFSLKASHSKISKTLMENADELYEQNLEMKQLSYQKNEILKELATYKSQILELNELKDHVHYLMNYIHDQKTELRNITIKHKSDQAASNLEIKPLEILKDLSAIVNKPEENIALQFKRSLAKLLMN